MLKKITNKITVSYAILISLLIVFLLLFFTDLVRKSHLAIIKSEMNEKIRVAELMLREKKPAAVLYPSAKDITELADILHVRLTLVGFNGRIIGDSSVGDLSHLDNHLYRIEIKEALGAGFGESIRYSNTLMADMFYFAKKTPHYIIRIARPLKEIDDSEKTVKSAILLMGLILMTVAVAVNIVISRSITRPINTTIHFATHFAHGDLGERILKYSNDEIGTLQRSLNSMADSLVEKITAMMIEQSKLELIINTINEGIAVIGRDKKMQLANEGFKSLFNIDYDCRKMIYYEVIRSSTLNSHIEKCFATETSVNIEDELVPDVICDTYIKPVKEDGHIQGILVVIHDITEKKRLDQMKTELVGNLSHELKTPVAIIKGYLETMNEFIEQPELCREYIRSALINVDRQDHIINDMIKLNMIETYMHFPMFEEIHIRDIINNCTGLLSSKISEKGIELIRKLDSLPEKLSGNRFLAEEIFFNIIDNAINYNKPDGKIRITSDVMPHTITVAIRDTGIGIPKESIGRIFERFYRVNKSRSRETGGTGLGLSIVRHAAILLNWDISVTSDISGTEFRIQIPC